MSGIKLWLRGSLICVALAAEASYASCVDPDLTGIADDVEIVLCDGTKVSGQMVLHECSNDGQTGCIATAATPSIDKSEIDPALFTASTKVGGVTGLMKECALDAGEHCIATPDFPALDTSTLNAAHFSPDLTVAGVTGTYIRAPDCVTDGQKNCNTTASFPAVAKASLDPRAIKKGVSLGGMTGRREPFRFCRNQANLELYDTSAPTNLPRMINSATQVNASTDVVTMPDAAHRLAVGSPLRFSSTGVLPGGIVANTTYYAILPGGTALKIASSAANAATATAIDITSAGSGTLTVMSAPNGVADLWDNIDDFNGADQSPVVSVFGDGNATRCDAGLIVDVTNTDPALTPSATIPPGGTHSFTTIYEETLTGLRLSNPVYDGTGTLNWTDALALCGQLDSGDGKGKWRLPTQKEWMTFYYAGGSRTFPATAKPYWAATSVSISLGKAFSFYPATGYMNEYWYDADKFLSTNGVICARWE